MLLYVFSLALQPNYAALIQPYATSEVAGYSFLNNGSEFQTAVNELNAHVASRTTAVNDYLD